MTKNVLNEICFRRQSIRAIETTAWVGKGRKSNHFLEFPPDISPGDNKVLAVVEEKASSSGHSLKINFDCLAWDWVAWPKGVSDRREDIW